MKQLDLTVDDVSQLPRAARQILDFSNNNLVFALHGEMGSGKTTLIKEMCRQLSSQDHFSSPSFSIVNQYVLANNASQLIYHIDLYRIKSREELLSIGIEDFLAGNEYCFIEWPEIAEGMLPDNTVHIHIRAEDGTRKISIFRR